MTARAILLAVVMAGCAPIDGSTCETDGATQCDGARVAYCERTSLGGLKWKAYDCPSGCSPTQANKCDWKGAVAGAECPEGRAAPVYCAGDQLADICFGSPGKWVRQPCAACRVGAKVNEALDCSSGVCRCG